MIQNEKDAFFAQYAHNTDNAVLEIIWQAKQTRATRLDLGNCGLTELPDALFELTWLEELFLCNIMSEYSFEKKEWERFISQNEVKLNNIKFINPKIKILRGLKILIANNQTDLSDLCPLKELTALQKLFVYNTQVSDLSPLKDLTALQQLFVLRTQVSDLCPLKDLKALQLLNVSSTRVSNLSPLKDLTALLQLDVSSTRVSDLSPLKDLTALQQLDVSATQVSDLSPLKDLKALQLLHVQRTQVSDLSPLKDLKALQLLNVQRTQVSDLSPLKDLKALQLLHVQRTQVSDLSPLKDITALQQLDVSATQVSDLSPLKDIMALHKLDVHSTLVHDLSPLKNLTTLQQLDVSFTQVSDLSPLKNLTTLQQLDVSWTQVSDLSHLKDLRTLQRLRVFGTKVSDLSPFKELTALQDLSVSSTQVSDLTPLKELTTLYRLDVRRCPIQYIPKEIYDRAEYNCAKDLYAYWQDLKQSQTTQNNQLKIMFLGNGCVGKTTLLHWFLDNAFKDLSLEDGRTHGIIIQSYTFKDSDVLAHFWDFGGQEVYHATHRLFLGRRSLYLLVWATESPDAAHEERHPPQYWLDMIADIGGNERSRVLIVQNLFDKQTERNILTDAERQDYEKRGLDITTYCINAKTGLKIKSLKTAIEEEAEQLLKTNIEELPTSWVNIRKAVADKRLAKDKTLARADFENICRDCGLTTDPSVILGYLHRAGELFHYDNQFILDQEWALKAVYAVLKRDRIERYKGVFTLEDLRDFWQKDNPNLTDEEANIFLNFMLANQTMFYTEGSYKDYGNNPEFVVPQLLPTDKPEMYSLWEEIPHKTRHQIEYTFLHRDIIERFIVATAHLSKKKSYWRNGLFIDYQNGKALVEVVLIEGKKRIQIECTGTTQTELLKTIREEFNKIRTLDKAKEYRFSNGDWEQVTGEIIQRAENMGGFKEKPITFELPKKGNISSQLTTKDSMKQYLLDLLAEGKLKQVFTEINKLKDTQSSYFSDPLVLLQSRFNRNENENNSGLSDPREYKTERNRIENAVKSLIDNEFDESKTPAPPKAEPKPAPKPENKPVVIARNEATEEAKPKVYFSYAWDGSNETGESREKIVQELYESLKADGYNVRRDKEDVGYKDSIEDFMKEIGRGSFIVVTISDKYLKSANCMFELLQIYRKSNSDFTAFKDKIYPIVLGDAKIYDPMDVLDYAIYWQEKKDKLEAKIKVVGLAMASGIIPDFDKFNEIANNIALISRMISSVNTLKPKMLSADNFAEIKKAIAAKAKG